MSLLRNLLDRFRATHPKPLPEPDDKLALGALMVRVAKSDRIYSVAEISLIDRVLARHFGLNPVAAAKMRATCEKLDAAAPGSDRFAALIREDLPFEARMEALCDLWLVVLADGEENPAEVAVVEAARQALGLSEADGAQAQERARSAT